MIFLKKFHAEGFKSFAKPLTLNFSNTMIGIIGPNGSGKSNIVDALRWAMGEQSNKNLRGKEKSNMIFVGSNDMKEADYALVELTFNNQDRILHCDFDEVKVSRKLIRKTGETIYSLNDQPCLLKDIHNIFIDSGLGKGSLGLISQGSVNWFAEAKSEERRQMFESAAGIGKYIKQKFETLQNLEKASINLERLDQYEKNLKREINELNKQVEKAQKYNEKIEQLKKYEISTSVQDYLTWTDELKELNNNVTNDDDKIQKLQMQVSYAKELRDDAQNKFHTSDLQIKQLSDEKDNLATLINELTYKKTRYISNLENNLSQGTIETRKESYISLINSEKQTLESLNRQLISSKNDLDDCNNRFKLLLSQKENILTNFKELEKEYFTKKTTLENLSALIKNNSSHDRGVNELLKSRDAIPGIINTIGNLINVPHDYEVAIQTILGRSINNLVVDNDLVATKAVKFLKTNNLGRATFLPLNIIKAKEVKKDTLTILKNLNGYIGVAIDLVKYDDRYYNAISSLLGNTIVANEIENANFISKNIYANYKIVTLDGDIVHAGGAISGGEAVSNNKSVFNLEEKYNIAKKEFEEISNSYNIAKIEDEKSRNEINSLDIKIRNHNVTILTLENQINDAKTKINRYTTDLESLDSSSDVSNLNSAIQDFEAQLLDNTEKQQKIIFELKNLEEIKQLNYENLAKYNTEYEECQQELNAITSKNWKEKTRQNNLINQVQKIEERISSAYGLTMETAISEYNKPLDITLSEAKRLIEILKLEIQALGNINFEALDTLNLRQEELSKMENEHNEAKNSVQSLLQLIDSLDKQAKNDFMNVIRKVNETLPIVFKSLFGGGSCEIKLVDPNNILESGIDVIVQLPGKKVSNLVLLSGGEKTLIALAVLFSLLKSSKFPLVLLDEAEAALDQANVSTFAKLIKEFSDSCQFIVITHRTGTMKMCDVLYGAMMRIKGVTEIIKTSFNDVNNKKESNINN